MLQAMEKSDKDLAGYQPRTRSMPFLIGDSVSYRSSTVSVSTNSGTTYDDDIAL